MRFLIDADMPRSTSVLLANEGHDVVDIRDIGMAAATDADVDALARREDRILVTGDLGFSDVRNYPPEARAGIAVIRSHRDATGAQITALVAALLADDAVLGRLPGRLAIVEPGRIRLR